MLFRFTITHELALGVPFRQQREAIEEVDAPTKQQAITKLKRRLRDRKVPDDESGYVNIWPMITEEVIDWADAPYFGRARENVDGSR